MKLSGKHSSTKRFIIGIISVVVFTIIIFGANYFINLQQISSKKEQIQKAYQNAYEHLQAPYNSELSYQDVNFIFTKIGEYILKNPRPQTSSPEEQKTNYVNSLMKYVNSNSPRQYTNNEILAALTALANVLSTPLPVNN